mmetsp:Transcript_7716/g.20020  ORF Transcript_7716/g.20020 Transcript_7716/m.20020 type:complete len:578 (-) Transcript_7716:1259-2992(-)
MTERRARFDDSDDTLTDLPSCWRKPKQMAEVEIQTKPVKTKNIRVQAVDKNEIEIQTEEEGHDGFLITPAEYLEEQFPGLGEFLGRVAGPMEEVLQRNAVSNPLSDFKVEWEDDHGETEAMFTLNHRPFTLSLLPEGLEEEGGGGGGDVLALDDEMENPEEKAMINGSLQATGLSWNSTGDVLGISYGRVDAVGSVAPRGGVAFWNLALSNVNENKASISLDTPCAAMCIAFHPKLPSIVAVGGYNGQIFIFDTSLASARKVAAAKASKEEGEDASGGGRQPDDPLIASSPMVDGTHKEAVSSLAWVEATPDGSSHILVSVAGDGRMLLWGYQKNEMKLPLASYSLTPVKRAGGDDDYLQSNKVVGATALQLSDWTRGTVIVGGESGGVYKGFLSSSVLSAALKDGGTKTPKPAPSPLNFAFASHQGPVYSLAFSPLNRSLFMSASADSTLSLRHILHPQPVAQFSPCPSALFSCLFSPNRATVFAAGTGDGRVLFYDLMKNRVSPSLALDLGTAGEVSAFQSPVLCMAFNNVRKRWFAAGDTRGVVKVWTMGDEWVNPAKGESLTLKNLLAKATKD